MLIAFLCDLTLLENSKGKISVSDVVRELYAKYRKPSAVRDGEEAVIETLRSHAELGPIVAGYVSGGKKIAWQQELSAAGIESGASDAIADLKVMRRPNSRQKKILDRLGYNSWRSAPRTSK
jgi:predicted metalloprotease with PDZ domain